MKFSMSTPLGPMHGEVDDRGALTSLAFGPVDAPPPPAPVREQLEQYFRGERQHFDLPLAPRGTAFQHAVWHELVRIPYGERISYQQLAARVGRPKAARAVGRANATNPIALIVPCHRVVGADGSLTGYAYGTAIKQRLLDLEATPR